MKKSINYVVIAIILSIFVILDIWFLMKPIDVRFGNYDSFTHSLGQLTGLIGTVLFAWVFVLSLKSNFIEDSFNGLDKMYKMHHLLGVASFVMLLFHPILLVLKFIPNDITQAAIYLWPSNSWAVNYGIISLLAMISLIILTFFVNLKYNVWKNYHRLMGIVFVIACFHIFLVTTDLTLSSSLKYSLMFICFMGLAAHVYESYLKRIFMTDYEYVVESIERKDNILDITMVPKSSAINFQAGQFAYIHFKDEKLKEKHPFTIASAPGQKLRICVKELGDFTSDLKNLKVGTCAVLAGPHGRFNAVIDHKPQIWIAGGIGITPFLSFLEEMADKKLSKQVDLFYCVKNARESVFLSELNRLAGQVKGVKIIPYFSDINGFLDVGKIKEFTSLDNKSIYLCCPPSMLASLKSQLREEGINRFAIKAEEFSLL